MANIASQRKRNARSLREHDENLRFKSAVKTHFKRLETAVSDGDAAPSPEAAALGGAEREALVAALNVLPSPDREVIGYRLLLGLSENETAEVLGVRPGTVKSRLSRAMTRLRAVVGEAG